MLALYSGGFCLSACLLKFVTLGISLCSDYANFTANALALPRTEHLGRQTISCDCVCTFTHPHTQWTVRAHPLQHIMSQIGIQIPYINVIPCIALLKALTRQITPSYSYSKVIGLMFFFLCDISYHTLKKQISFQIILSSSADCSNQALYKQHEQFLNAWNQTVNKFSPSLCRWSRYNRIKWAQSHIFSI